ncbi:MAG: DNA/RNA non-specific endonuclease [Vicinamibacterales bacterium]
MERSKRVRKERMGLAAHAYERWKGFQLDRGAMEGARANRDGSIPRPTIAAITPLQRSRFKERETRRAIFDSAAYRDLRIAAERQVGATLDFADLPPNEQALKAGRPVVRIVTLGGPGIAPEGFATGFLVAPDLLLTNHHVFRTADEAVGAGAHFLYERTQGGLREGVIFELDPDRFFVNHKGLDYAIVAVKPTALDGAPLSQFQYLPLIAVKGKILKGDPVNIIQHPEGRPKQYATVNNQLLDLRDDGFLLYETDTLEGSSGAPVFNQYWETIGLHHCGVPRIENGQLVTRDGRRLPLDAEVADSDLIWIANEGVRVSALVASLADQRLDRPEQQGTLQRLIATTNDPLLMVAEKSPLVTGTPAASLSLPNDPTALMAQNVFQFSGPATIHVNTSPAAIPATVAITESPTPAGTSDAEFREKTLKFDENYQGRDNLGYRMDFLDGWNLPAPSLNCDHTGEPLLNESGDPWVIPYYHYSLVMNRDRRLLAWAGSNVDYSATARRKTKTRKEYGGENWRLDPRVALAAPGLQIEDADFYAPAKKIDRGHIVRREDGAWGASAKEAEFGNSDTYHWTNCTPQSEAFNQSGKSGMWGQFEDHIQQQVKAVGSRMSVFAGPVLNPDDPEHGYGDGTPIQVPMEFWKVVVCVSREAGQTERLAYGFVFDQTEPVQRLGYERMNMEDFEIYQMPIEEITRKTGVVFDQSVLDADVLRGGGMNESIRGFQAKRINSVQSIVLR